jgi:hypothetical protein
MAQDLVASLYDHIATRTAVNSTFSSVAMVWLLDWYAMSGVALRRVQQAPRVDRPPPASCYATSVSLPATQGQRERAQEHPYCIDTVLFARSISPSCEIACGMRSWW